MISTLLVLLSVATAPPYQITALETSGNLRGKVIVKTPKPVSEKVAVHQDQTACGDWVESNALLISAKKEVANVIISIEKITQGKPLNSAITALTQKGCQFIPRVQAISQPGKLVMENQDAALHTANASQHQKSLFNAAFPIKGMKIKKKIKKSGMVEFSCDAGHHWMKAFVYISPHPYVDVTSPDGTFELPQIPPGTYTLKAWHEVLGEIYSTFTIAPGKTTDLEMRFP